jgi:3-hydroxybutyryl-CoA dehydratase
VTELDVGVMLGPCVLVVDQQVVARYGDAAVDHNPIHFDTDAARGLGLRGPIAHGMISGALIGRLLAAELGPRWLRQGRLRLKFVAPVEVGSTVIARGWVTATDPLSVEVRAETSSGVLAITGSATLDVSDRQP